MLVGPYRKVAAAGNSNDKPKADTYIMRTIYSLKITLHCYKITQGDFYDPMEKYDYRFSGT